MFRNRFKGETDSSNYIILKYKGNDSNAVGLFNSKFDTTSIKKILFNNKEIPISNSYIFNNNISNDVIIFFKRPLTDCGYMFANCSNLETINLNYLDTLSITNMSHMFDQCISLNHMPLNNLNLENVTNMQYLFSGCNSINKVVEFKNLKIKKLTDISYIFNNTSVTSVDFSGLDTSNIIYMNNMFSNNYDINFLKIITPVDKVTKAANIFSIIVILFIRGTFVYNKSYNYDILKIPTLWTKTPI